MSIPVGLTVPKLLPVTGTFAPAFGAYFALLAFRVSFARQATKTTLGERSRHSSKAQADAGAASVEEDSLLIATRSHANLVENVPFALLIASIVELNGGDRRALTASLAGLLLARIVHVEFGLRAKGAVGWGRPVGTLSTLGIIVGLSSYAAYLVKSYWGF
ncbi:hypothetical protein ABEF95_010884 [Exophiala dermatitidis]